MNLLDLIGLGSPDDIDPDRPLDIAGFTLGPDASREAALLATHGITKSVQCSSKSNVSIPLYWLLSRQGNEIGEAFCFPKGQLIGLPTALEIAFVRSIAAVEEQEFSKIVDGDCLVSIGDAADLSKICEVLYAVRPPIFGHSVLAGQYGSIDLTEADDKQLSRPVIKCLQGSFEAMPVKFRFLELYRSMEARFLRELKESLLAEFDAQPKAALESATKKLKSELAQFLLLSEIKKPYFEMIWSAAHNLRTTNRLAIALFRKLSEHDLANSQSKSGAALIYFLRCAIVHAGQKDMIYEAYPDGEHFLNVIMEHVEEASLALAGIHLS
ncbi:hypothetical protein [Sphingopyxis sp. PET50]|uniref:hypothetical protein n=1 Tax=Sphingopyxis sp. PET50 TaxID=2976533 RepID=UPI0021AEB09F|nr:hypothetical protein [Sphingopyxis sp. PET50]